MKIAIYTDCNSRGGVYVYAIRMALALKDRGYDVHILSHAPRKDMEEELFASLKSAANTLICFSREGELEISCLAKEIAAYINQNGIDVYIPNCRDAPMMATQYILTARVALICHSNHSSYYKFIYRYDTVVDLVVYPNKAGLVYCSKNHKKHKANYLYIPHFVEGDACENKNKKSDPVVLIYFGRIEQEQKCIFELVRIGVQLKKIGLSFRLDIYGNGSAELSLREAIIEAGLDQEINVNSALPWDELKPIVAEAHFSILTSAYEGFCYSAAESMMLGVPLACYENSAITDYVLDGKNAIMVPWGDADLIANKIAEVVKNNNKYTRMCELARDSIKNKMTKRIVIDQYVEAFEMALREPLEKKWPMLRPKKTPGIINPIGYAIERVGKCVGIWK